MLLAFVVLDRLLFHRRSPFREEARGAQLVQRPAIVITAAARYEADSFKGGRLRAKKLGSGSGQRSIRTFCGIPFCHARMIARRNSGALVVSAHGLYRVRADRA